LTKERNKIIKPCSRLSTVRGLQKLFSLFCRELHSQRDRRNAWPTNRISS